MLRIIHGSIGQKKKQLSILPFQHIESGFQAAKPGGALGIGQNSFDHFVLRGKKNSLHIYRWRSLEPYIWGNGARGHQGKNPLPFDFAAKNLQIPRETIGNRVLALQRPFTEISLEIPAEGGNPVAARNKIFQEKKGPAPQGRLASGFPREYPTTRRLPIPPETEPRPCR